MCRCLGIFWMCGQCDMKIWNSLRFVFLGFWLIFFIHPVTSSISLTQWHGKWVQFSGNIHRERSWLMFCIGLWSTAGVFKSLIHWLGEPWLSACPRFVSSRAEPIRNSHCRHTQCNRAQEWAVSFIFLMEQVLLEWGLSSGYHQTTSANVDVVEWESEL